MSKPRVIAFYLPQFYPTPENDKWWGKGFTEWTNVGKAKPLFKGHYQPRVPADLGYYDLRIPEVRVQQAKLAMEAGIEGFCYWHYWFSGRELLDRVFKEVVESGSPNFPFCLCWANHSWYKKTWTAEGQDRLLIEQTYDGIEDYKSHFYSLLTAFRDPRYIKIEGKLVFGIFAPLDFPDVSLFMNCWNELAKENGLDGFCFFGYTIAPYDLPKIIKRGFNKVVIDYVRGSVNRKGIAVRGGSMLKREIFGVGRHFSYKEYVDECIRQYVPSDNLWPSIDPNFDHSPRSGGKGIILTENSPKEWGRLCRSIFNITKGKSYESNIVFVKAWNEWGEGNYLEPDIVYGREYLDQLKDAIDSI